MYKRIVVAGLALAALTLAPYSASASKSGNEVRIEDRCEPVSFNAALQNPDACVGGGTTTFDEFLEKLNPVDFGDDHWRFQVSGSAIKVGESIEVVNNGGEFHTFTEVKAFGGGCVDLLNGPLGNLVPVPECAPVIDTPNGPIPLAFATTGVGPLGATIEVSDLAKGQHQFMCLIHPWMRTVVTVK